MDSNDYLQKYYESHQKHVREMKRAIWGHFWATVLMGVATIGAVFALIANIVNFIGSN